MPDVTLNEILLKLEDLSRRVTQLENKRIGTGVVLTGASKLAQDYVAKKKEDISKVGSTNG